MKNLQIINRDGILLTDSRQVAEMVGKDHSKLIRDIRTYCDYLNGAKIGLVDFFIGSTYKDGKGEERPCYLITKKGCEMVANKMTGQKGVLFTAAYVTQFEKMEQALLQPRLPQDYVSALRSLADEVEQKTKLQNKIEQDKPKVMFADSVTASDDAILVRELAKIACQSGVKNMGEKRLFAWLRAKGYLIRKIGDDYNTPTQTSTDMGLIVVVKTTVARPDKPPKVRKTPKITGKGQLYFINKLLQEQEVQS